MSKKIEYKSRLDINKIPMPKKKEEGGKKERGKLGLLSRKKLAQPISFRMRPEVIDMLNDLVIRMNHQARLRLTKIAVLELCIQHAAQDKSLEELIAYYHKEIV